MQQSQKQDCTFQIMLATRRGLRVKDFTKTIYLQHKKTFTDTKNPLAFFKENTITKIFQFPSTFDFRNYISNSHVFC